MTADQAPADELRAELERCTKAELIALIRSRAFYVSPKDVRCVRGEVLYERGVRLTEKALAMMDEAKEQSHAGSPGAMGPREPDVRSRDGSCETGPPRMRGWA